MVGGAGESIANGVGESDASGRGLGEDPIEAGCRVEGAQNGEEVSCGFGKVAGAAQRECRGGGAAGESVEARKGPAGDDQQAEARERGKICGKGAQLGER